MDKAAVVKFTTEVRAAVDAVAKKHNLKESGWHCNYSDDGVTLKLEFGRIASDGIVMSKEAIAYKHYCEYYGLKPEELGKEFSDYRGARYKITGLADPRSNNIVCAKNLKDGKNWKIHITTVLRALGRTEKEVNDSHWNGKSCDFVNEAEAKVS